MNVPYYEDDHVTLYHGDCIDAMAELAADSVDAIVTDPPYGLGFMGKAWDALPPGLPWARECLRVLKPGGYLLAFGGTRTWHRLAVAVEDAGFEIRDSIAWLYGSGFPKSLDVSKALAKLQTKPDPLVLSDDEHRFCHWMATYSGLTALDCRRLFGSDRFITGLVDVVNTATVDAPRMGRRAMVPTWEAWQRARPELGKVPDWVEAFVKDPPKPPMQTPSEWKAGKGEGTAGSSATPEAARWSGWGTALKPAFEPIVVARKPFPSTVAANVLEHGTGALNIDATRIGSGDDRTNGGATGKRVSATEHGYGGGAWSNADEGTTRPTGGRWPANVALDADQATALDQMSGFSKSPPVGSVARTRGGNTIGTFAHEGRPASPNGHGDSGGASRFFYTAKADSAERPERDGIAHPTVKPLSLMRWLVRLVTPPGGIILDPFAGSGTTVEAAILEGFRCIAIEREADYLPLILQRIHRRLDPVAYLTNKGDDLGLFGESA